MSFRTRNSTPPAVVVVGKCRRDKRRGSVRPEVLNLIIIISLGIFYNTKMGLISLSFLICCWWSILFYAALLVTVSLTGIPCPLKSFASACGEDYG